MKYTQGKWAFDEKRNAIYSTTEWLVEPSKVDDEEGVPIDVISTFSAMGGNDTMADIKLIVVAPELLEIVMKIAFYYDVNNGGTTKPLSDNILDELNQIIKKATE